MENKNQEGRWKSLQELYNTPANLRLKYVAIAVIAVATVLIMARIIWPGIPVELYLFLRGCAGLCAIVFVVLAGTLVFRVNNEFINQKKKSDK